MTMQAFVLMETKKGWILPRVVNVTLSTSAFESLRKIALNIELANEFLCGLTGWLTCSQGHCV
jgi:hypothetical protein